MAIDPSTRYGVQVDTSTDPTGYPYGQARNITVGGDGTGTPFEKDHLNDLWGFEQALLDEAGITPSGTPDKVGASQYLDALDTLYYRQSDVDSAVAAAESDAVATSNGYTDAEIAAALASGAYTPTISSTSGITSTSVSKAVYSRVGDIVTVTARINFTATAGQKSCFISLPIDPSFTLATQALGLCNDDSDDASSVPGWVQAQSTNLALLRWRSAPTSGTHILFAQFQYELQ